MIHTIERLPSTTMGVFGYATFGDREFVSVERPWLNNQRSISCIPLGAYNLVHHNSAKHPNTFALVNEVLGVYHHDHPLAKRTEILIHVANNMFDLEGCIGLGTEFGCLQGKWSVRHSVTAVQAALARIEEGDVLNITLRNTL
jgi:hypothetical protein